MRRLLLVLFLGSVALATTIRLRNGTLLTGEVTDHDEKGLTLHRADNGGEVTVAWSQLDADEAKRVQDSLKLPEEKGELTIEGSRLTLDNGTTVEGRLVEDKPDILVIKTLTGNKRIPRASVKKVDPVQLPALSFCTADELYEQKAKALDTRDAKAEFALGQYCISLKLFDKAKEHLRAALALDSSLGPEVQKRLSLVDRAGKDAEAQELKDKALAALAAHKYDDALAAAQKLASDFGGTAAGHDAADLVKKIQDEQAQFASNPTKVVDNKVVDAWFDETDSLLRKAATQKGLTLSAAMAYVEKTIVNEIKLKLADTLKMKPEEVEAAFRARQLADTKTASYGEGTWVKDNLRTQRENKPASLEESADRDKNAAAIDTEQKKLDMTKLPEDWWGKATTQVKMNWLRAYNAERNFQVTEVHYEPCAKCKAKGLSGTALCTRCYGLHADRVVTFR